MIRLPVNKLPTCLVIQPGSCRSLGVILESISSAGEYTNLDLEEPKLIFPLKLLRWQSEGLVDRYQDMCGDPFGDRESRMERQVAPKDWQVGGIRNCRCKPQCSVLP